MVGGVVGACVVGVCARCVRGVLVCVCVVGFVFWVLTCEGDPKGREQLVERWHVGAFGVG